jgi:O-antigen ligase
LPVFFGILIFNWKYLQNRLERIFVLLGLSLAAGVLLRTVMAPDTTIYGVIGSWILVFVVASGFAAYVLGLRGVPVHKTLVIVCFVIAALVPLAPILVAISPEAYDPYYLKVYGYSNVRVLGYFAGMALTVFILMLPRVIELSKCNISYLFGYTLALSGVWSILFWSGSRAGLVAVPTAVFMSWALIKWPSFKSILLTFGAAIAGGFASLLYFEPDGEFGLIGRIHKTTSGLTSGNMTQVTSNRNDLWYWAMDRIMEAPWGGHGLYAMSHMRTEDLNFFHTHNVILEFALSAGIPFTVLLVCIVLVLFVKAGLVARRSGDSFAVSCFGLVVMIAGFAQLTAALFFPFTQMVFLMGLGGLIALGQRYRSTAPGSGRTSVDMGE